MKILSLLAVGFALSATPGFAQSEEMGPPSGSNEGDWSGFISAGPGVAPEFDGSDDLQIIPYISADLRYRDVTLEVRGLGARLDVLSALTSDVIYGGPVVRFKLGRDDTLGSIGDPVRFLNEVDFETQAGAYLGVAMGGNANGQGEVRIDVTAVAGANGFEATGQISYALVRSRSFFIDISNSVTYADAEATRTYFGVTPAEAARSGLIAYTPDAGVRDVSSGLTLGYMFSERWGVVANTNYSYLVGDAGRSPIVRGRVIGPSGEGSRSQFVGGIGIFFRF